MKGTNLGEFEELVLLITASLGKDAYTVSITDELEAKTGRKVVLSVAHSALHRLEKKGYVKSKLEGATQQRGGRRKRVFTITKSGMSVLTTVKSQRDELWQLIPHYNLPK